MRVHISLPVSDVPSSIGFYQRLLGREASKVRDDYANFRLDGPALHLEDLTGSHGSRSW